MEQSQTSLIHGLSLKKKREKKQYKKSRKSTLKKYNIESLKKYLQKIKTFKNYILL